MIKLRFIPGYDDRYMVSSDGVILYKARGTGEYIPMKLQDHKWGYKVVSLYKDRHRSLMTVHKIVMLAFVGERPEGMETRHLDGDPTNNCLSNLAYGTAVENAQDQLRHGTNNNSRKTHCKNGHEFNEKNSYRPARNPTHRVCRICDNARRRRGTKNGRRNS